MDKKDYCKENKDILSKKAKEYYKRNRDALLTNHKNTIKITEK